MPNGLAPRNVTRYGIGILVYVRYRKGSEDGYAYIGAESPEKFLSMFQDECRSEDGWYKGAPPLSPMSKIEEVATLGGQPYVDPEKESAVWLVLLRGSRPVRPKAC